MSDAWRNKLSRGFRGLDGDVRNVVIALTNHEDWAGKIAYDEFKDAITLRGALPWSEDEAPAETRGGALTPSDVTRIVMWFERAMVIRTDEKTVRQALHVVAEKRPYHPVREYLLGLKWDGEKRLDHVLHTHFGAQDTLYTQTIGPKFLISAVARVMRPGCQVDTVLILESPKQGWKKSSTLRALVPVASWYCESMLPLGRKDAYDNLRGVWIYHLDELESMTRADQSQLKSFITNTHDRYRKAYEVDAQDHPRNNVFVGSTNEKYYLNDSTGGRRFWGCELERIIDVEKVVRDRDQIWAEARVRWERGEKWHIEDSALIELCETEQASRMEENPFLGPIERWYASQERMRGEDWEGPTASEAVEEALGRAPVDITRGDLMKASAALRAIGCKRGRPRGDISRGVRRYTRRPHLSLVKSGSGPTLDQPGPTSGYPRNPNDIQ